MKHSSQHTLNLFKKIYHELPPLVPDEIESNMADALEQIENNMSLSQEEIESTMIDFGKKTWAYRKAFHEFVDIYEGKIGEKILLSKMPRSFKLKYKEFKEEGYNFKDLYSGKEIKYFDLEVRTKLAQVLSELRAEVKDHVRQLVLSSEKDRYLEKISEFKDVLAQVEEHLEELKDLAENEQEHPEIVTEIKEQIKAFEHSLSGLGPPLDHEAVERSAEFFEGRKQVKQNFKFAK
jgi:hypothetical protein